jgi:uncharacterized repeat protein (TIGR03806 family)
MRFFWTTTNCFCLPFLALSAVTPALGGLLSPSNPYLENGGRVGGEAENYHATVTRQGISWIENFGLPNARSGLYMQALPDNTTGTMSFPSGPSIDYLVNIQTTGRYRLYLRWDGYNDASDSIFAGIVELADGVGGVPDWYQDSGHMDGDFAIDGWDGLGGAEQNTAAASQDPMEWDITTPGTYTLRIVAREDGACLDAWILQLSSLPEPSGEGFPITVADAVTMNYQTKAGVAVLGNDTGLINPATVAIASPPSSGTAVPMTDGRILYTHTSGTPATDSFTYTVQDTLGVTSAPATVTVTFSTAMRIPATTVAMPLSPPPAVYTVEDAFPTFNFSLPTSIDTPPGTNSLVVTERSGWIHIIPDMGAANPVQQLFMNLQDRVNNSGNENAMKGVAFHPDYQNNRYFFLSYNYTGVGGDRMRVSRFETFAGNPLAGDPNSEVVLIDQPHASSIHTIAGLDFGPDGYLYIGLGDDGDSTNKAQKIDGDIFSALLRIDVDKLPGNPEPNAHPSIPTDGSGDAYFSVPADNPFIGATSFNGAAVNPANVRTEFYAVGFRNPWRFCFDTANGWILLGDVGQNDWEEINIVTAGGNYGWPFFEGNNTFSGTPPSGFVHSTPLYEYGHGGGEFEGFSVTAGLVYRGSGYSALFGKFIFADLVTSNIWALEQTGGAPVVTRIAGQGGIVEFGIDPVTDEILMVDYTASTIRRLKLSPPSTGSFPNLLSETGFFADLSDLSPNPGVVAYTPNLSFWSDHAIKDRFFSIPDGVSTMGYERDGPWVYPAGMMWVKHFELETTRGDPETRKRIETRVLVRNSGGAYGVSYRWNEAGTEATLVAEAGESFDLAIDDDGVIKSQTWDIPSRAQCFSCHTPKAGFSLSFNTPQLNREGTIAGAQGNVIDLLLAAGYIDALPDSTSILPRHVRPDELDFSLEARARSFLAVNCAYCHQPDSGTAAPETWDARHHRTLAETGMVDGEAGENGGNPANKLIVPGNTANSIIYNRVAEANGFTRMPPLASNELDEEGIQLLADWIQELSGEQSFNEWRLAQFGNGTSVEGEPGFDADGDSRTNEEEFIERTDPNDGGDFWMGEIRVENGSVTVAYELFGRSVVIEYSPDLVSWDDWDADGNKGIPLAPGVVREISVPMMDDAGFFRFRVTDI